MAYDSKNDFYKVLGVEPATDAKKIKLAYYKLAQKYHPDKAGDDPKTTEKFKNISNAYEVLVDDDQRKAYDKLRNDAKNPHTQGYNSRKSQGGQASSYSSKRGARRDE